ncbi:hypothetical protein JOB18_035457 [Solea senegalensis]|uniref:Uncharacterized protein n=1 Tax=Solea senegalensis TaxID=28829 RepID=A0AAV6TAH1_SOLSE|nr:hypothetical protein JOB18_035457 [Solea senegalensis]
MEAWCVALRVAKRKFWHISAKSEQRCSQQCATRPEEFHRSLYNRPVWTLVSCPHCVDVHSEERVSTRCVRYRWKENCRCNHLHLEYYTWDLFLTSLTDFKVIKVLFIL